MSFRAHSSTLRTSIKASERSLKRNRPSQRSCTRSVTLEASPTTRNNAPHGSLAIEAAPIPFLSPLIRIDEIGVNDEGITEPHFHSRVAIDFGTTYTAAAFIVDKIIIPVESWPMNPLPDAPGKQIPSVLLYPEHAEEPIDCNDAEPSHHSHGLQEEESEIVGGFDISIFGRLTVPREYKHGYEAEHHLQLPISFRERYPTSGHIQGMKLLLDNSAYTQNSRDQLYETVENLKKKGQIQDAEDVIKDFLIPLFSTIQIEMEMQGVKDTSNVEVIITVPACWTPKACSIMAKAVREAMKTANFFLRQRRDVPHLFMVNEAEAAATYIINSGGHHVKSNQSFILMDCGGGTVDTGIYRICHRDPFRLAAEILVPEGIINGANFLNEGLREFAREELSKEPSLLEDAIRDSSLEHLIVAEILPSFEKLKRTVNFTSYRKYYFKVPGLRASKVNGRICKDLFILTHDDMWNIFYPCLSAIADLMERQVQKALDRGVRVDKILAVGGFSDSPALQIHLQARLEKIKQKFEMQDLELIMAGRGASCATGVAHGAILRALDKSNGPKKMARLSIGILRHFPYEPETILEHPEMEPLHEGERSKDEFNGLWYIKNTIVWLIKAGQGPVASKHTATYISEFVWSDLKEDWIAKEVVYESEICAADYYQTIHSKNKGKVTKIGTLKLDLNFLKGKIKPEPRKLRSQKKKHYVACILIKTVLIDRDFKFFAFWPARDGQLIDGSQQTVNIVATFLPGTK